MNYMKKCSCAYCNGDIYKVDVNSFARVRRRGVSGILRVKNDAEFLAESIDSCIDALVADISIVSGSVSRTNIAAAAHAEA